LRTSKFLVAFLQEANQDKFNIKLISIEEEKGPKSILHFKTLTGEIDVDRKERAEKFCNQLGDFSTEYERINAFVSKQVKLLQFRSHELADDFYAIGAEISRFSELLKQTEIP
jgi:hypothetical protein